MKAPIFPVFALKTIGNKVVIGGGGGNEHFGKKNGLVLLDDTTYKDLDFLETEDIILGISIYKPGVNELNLKEEELDWDEHDDSDDQEELKKGRAEILSEDKSNKELKKGEISISSEDQEEIKKDAPIDVSKNEKLSDNSDILSSTPTNAGTEKEVYLSCRGTNNFYLVSLSDSKFSLIKKVDKVVTFQYFINSLFLIINKELFCILNVLQNQQKLDKLTKKKQKGANYSLADSAHEEYVYSLFKKNDKILVEREEGRTDVPEKWESFFIDGHKIHKVVLENEKYTFVFRNKKYEYEKEIGDIFCYDGLLVFFLRGADSQLIFVDDVQKVYDIPKITCMNVEGDFISVGTGDGVGYLFKGYMEISKRKLCDYAITGISYNEGYFYYSSYNGLVDRKCTLSSTCLIFKISGFIVVLLAIIYAFLMKR